MASRERPAEPRRPAPRLCLVTPQDTGGLAQRLAEALAAADIAAVLLRLPDGDERARVDHVKALAPAIQNKGTAFLLDAHAKLAVRTGADGAHLGGIEALTAALPLLKPTRIARCGRVASRPDALPAGEAGAAHATFGRARASGGGPPSRPSPSAWRGGQSCSKSPASDSPLRSTR